MRKLMLLLSLLLLSIPCVYAEGSKYAFVTMYYPGGKLSYSNLIGIRTMFNSFQTVKSKAEFIVLTIPSTPKSAIQQFEKDGMKTLIMDIPNAYKQSKIPADYQKTKNIAYLWKLEDYKRVIFVDYYTIFVNNMDSLFDCSYLCVKDEQPLLYSNEMMVITPGHEESLQLYNTCVNSEATYDQYILYNRYGYYATELYELSQAAPVFELGDAERSDSVLRRFYNFVNFPAMMWYEKFSWDLYSCSGLKNSEIPVYTINFRYTIGHKSFFLPTDFFDYRYIYDLSPYYLKWRSRLHETFFFPTFYSMCIVAGLLLASKYLSAAVSWCVVAIYNLLKGRCKYIYCSTALGKLAVASIILVLWIIAINAVPDSIIPSLGYLIFFCYFTTFLSIVLVGFNNATNSIIGSKLSMRIQLAILLILSGVLAFIYVFPIVSKLPVFYRFALMFVQVFTYIYCLFSQISPLFAKSSVAYKALPE